MTNVTLRSGSSDTLGSGEDPLQTQLVARRSRLQSLIRQVTDPASPMPTCFGVVVALAGFGLIGYAWSQIAGLVDVWRQMPYLVSAGLPGLGLILTGLVIINVSARRQDSAARARQMETLTEAMRDLQRSLDT
jgi:hypothetical protein